MKDMKLAARAKEGETMLGADAAEPDRPEYPYGLRINLDNETLTKLGMTELPEIDQEFKITALACVVSVSQHDNKGSDKPDRSVDLQIEMMDLLRASEETKSAAERLYGE